MNDDKRQFDITFIGHFSKDIIIVGDETRTSSGGAVFFGSIPAARIGVRAAAVTKAAKADFHLLAPMEKEGVAVFAFESENTTSIENRYLDKTLERRVCRPLGFAGAYSTEMFDGIESSVWHVAGLIKGETDVSLLRFLSSRGKLSADAQGFVRVIRGPEMVNEDWKEKRDAMPLLSFFKADAAEAEILTGLTDVRDAARALADMGAREIVLSHPCGLLIHADGEFSNTPFTPKNMRGRTGRGDTCMSAFLSWRLNHSPEEAGRFAATLCSIKMESEGPFSGTLDDVMKRMN